MFGKLGNDEGGISLTRARDERGREWHRRENGSAFPMVRLRLAEAGESVGMFAPSAMTPTVRRNRTSPRAGLSTLLLTLVVLVTPGCGTLLYDRAWSRFELTGKGGGMEGRWEGEWRSDRNGHSGKLRCMMTPQDEDAYLASFHSTFAWILFYRHETVFRMTAEEDGTLFFAGSEDLGKLAGGVYLYEGTVTGNVFAATYEAENGDHGVFEMRRVDETAERP